MPRRLRTTTTALTALAVLALSASVASADLPRQVKADAAASAFRAATVKIPVREQPLPAGAQVLKYKFGPMTIQPGQNYINVDVQQQRPNVDGWIVGFRPGLVYADTGKSPNVNIVHLHHAVWLVGDPGKPLKPTFAAGEEKTVFNVPDGYGWRYTTKQSWLINHMIHDLTPNGQKVYITYSLVFIPDTAPQAQSIKRVDTQWMDVEGVKPYPVFNVLKGSGKGGRATFPDQARNPYPDGRVRNRWVADRDATLVATAGHLHPGGLFTDLNITRDGKTVRLFRSRAQYFDPVGAVSWDVAMSATAPDWRVAIKQGDVLSTNATYDTSRASWYEVMGIMPIAITEGADGGVDPFAGKIDQTDYLTHGRLKENVDENVRRSNPAYTNAIRSRPGPLVDTVVIKNYTYQQGDLTLRGKSGRPATVRQGRQLTFVNKDPLNVAFHTITSCKSPCNTTTGIGNPLADGRGGFDSGELGFGPTISESSYSGSATTSIPFTAVVDIPAKPTDCAPIGLAAVIKNGCVGSATWKTPKSLSPGTYTYFCRVHPFMRGAFRVVPGKKS
jgi:hypothetical protein